MTSHAILARVAHGEQFSAQVCYGRIEARRGRFVVLQGMRLDYYASDSLSWSGHVTTA